MKNQNQIIRRTVAVMLACALIAGLLPGFAAAQDQSAPPVLYQIPTFQPEPELEARRQFVIEQVAALALPAPNTQRYLGTAILKAKLQLNPNDAAVLQRASEYWGTLENPWPRWSSSHPDGVGPGQFTEPGIAWIFSKYWDNFTPAQRENILEMAKIRQTALDHGTENHMLMFNIPTYIFAELWPDEDGWFSSGYTSAEVRQIVKARLLQRVNSYLDKNHSEFISQIYFHANVYPWHVLFDCVQDPELKHAAYVALCYHYTAFAANTFRGLAIGPFPRGQLQPVSGRSGSSALTWFWAGPDFSAYVPTTSGDFSITNWQSRPQMALAAAVGDFVMPPAILSLWRGETAPYELTTSAHSDNNWSTSPGYWGTGEPGGNLNRYIYRHPDYAIGSGFFEYYPDGFYNQNNNAVNILYRSNKVWAFIDTQHHYWRSDDLEWGWGNNSPFCQMAQHKSAAISIFNIPETDPWAGRGRSDWYPMRDGHYDNLIKEVFVRYPKTIDEMVQDNGWVFLREGSVYIAIRPLKPYTIQTNPVGSMSEFGAVATNFNAISTTSAQTGFVYDVATSAEFASFSAFRAAAIQNPPTVDWNTLSVTYTSLAGNTITATWNPPNYSGPKVTNWRYSVPGSLIGDFSNTATLMGGSVTGGFSWDDVNKQWSGPQGDKWYPGSRVLVRPHITINGAVVPPPREYTPDRRPGQDPADFDYYIPMKSPSANIADGVLSLQTLAGEFVVDWRGKAIGSHYYAPQIEFTDSISGKPIENLEVILRGGKYITDAQGMIFIPEILGGSYKLAVSDSRFVFTENPVIGIHSDSLFRIQMKRKPQLTLRMINRTTGAPVNRASVIAEGKTYPSDASGFFNYVLSSPGALITRVEHKDYFPVSDTLLILVDTTIQISLTPKMANVTFSFSDINGLVSGVKVTMSGFSQYTNSSGIAFFSSQQAREKYSWSAEKSGYHALQDSFHLETDTTLQVTMELGTMVQEKSGDNHFLVYPNPAHDYLFIDREIPLAVPVKIDLVNVLGGSVYSAQEVTLPYTLRLKGVNPGIYVLKITFPEGFSNQTITLK